MEIQLRFQNKSSIAFRIIGLVFGITNIFCIHKQKFTCTKSENYPKIIIKLAEVKDIKVNNQFLIQLTSA